MGYSHNSDKIARIVAAIEEGRSREAVAEEFGVKPQTVRVYCVRARTEQKHERDYRGKEPRCKCGLLLPCECGGRGLHATDFMYSNDRPALNAALPRARNW